MNAKVLSSLTAALVVTSFVPPAIAEPMGDHPAVVVARTWNHRGIDPNTFIVAPPASTQWVSEAPKTADESLTPVSPRSSIGQRPSAQAMPRVPSRRAAEVVTPQSPRHTLSGPHWTASIGTGTAATSRSAVPNTNAPLSSGTQPIVAATHWTSRIGSGHPFASASPVKYTSVANNR